jgi:hypothetical protein
MVIINRLKKTIAALMALTISATSMGAISADAYGITYCKDSEFKYEMNARIVSDTQIELMVNVTNNPGFHELGFTMYYEGCKAPKCIVAYDFESGFSSVPAFAVNDKLQNCSYNLTMLDGSKNDQDYTGAFYLRYVFNVDNAYKDICEFKMCVSAYGSYNENIQFSIRGEDFFDYNEPPVITAPNDIRYIIGDMDNNGIIDISDASAIGRLVGFTENKQGISVEDLNTIISRGSFDPYNPNHFDCSAEFPDMVCAEVADATCEGQITLEDSKEVLTCYANNMSSIPYEGLTGKVQIKKILVPVPNNI